MFLKTIAITLALSLVLILSLDGPALAAWQTFRAEDGLLSNLVYSILQDSSGNFWFGVNGGVSIYDGVSFTECATFDEYGVGSVFDMIEDSSGNLWFGGVIDGVLRFDGISWTHYTRYDGLSHNVVNAIFQDSSGDMWFATTTGVSRYDGVNWNTYNTSHGLPGRSVKAIAEDTSGDLWVGTSEGVGRYDGVSWRTYTIADGLANDDVRAMIGDSSGNLWVGTAGGVSRYDGVGWTTYTAADGLAGNDVKAILEDSSGDMWFGTTYSGVSRFDGVGWRTYTTADGLTADNVEEIVEDGSGHLWFGTTVGVSRYDGVSWTTFTAIDGLAHDNVNAIIEDSSKNMWFATWGGGVSRYDGAGWTTYTEADGLVNDIVWTIVEDSSGDMWFATTTGVSRYDGVSWRTYTEADGLVSDNVNAIFQDSSGDMWFGTVGGVSRYDGVSWTAYTEADGLMRDFVSVVVQDSSGDMWFGTSGGVSRFDGVSWTNYTTADGLVYNTVFGILEDSSGDMWFGTPLGLSRFDGVGWKTYTEADGLPIFISVPTTMTEDGFGGLWFTITTGVSRYDGVNWTNYTIADGLASNSTSAIAEDHLGRMWFGTRGYGVTLHEPDRSPPQTVIWPRPPALMANTTVTIAFMAAFKETPSVLFSHSFDGSPWSEWSGMNVWLGQDVSEGPHEFSVRARDKAYNVDPTPAFHNFEIDVTPPDPVISKPVFGQAVSDSVSIKGTADDLRFMSYMLEVRPVGSADWDSLAVSTVSVADGVLAGWNTMQVPDGDYELRLSVKDTLGLTGTAIVQVIVDNEPPWAYETTPAVIKSESGGHVYTTGKEAHLYFPPNAFATDTEVRIEGLRRTDVPDTLPGGAVRVLAGYEISWGDTLLAKPGTLELSYEGFEFDRDADPGSYPDVATFALFLRGTDSEWRRLGGTVNTEARTILAHLGEAGLYSVFTGGRAAGDGSALSALSITPRVFSPRGGFAAPQAAIGFTLGRPGPVTVKIYNRAGRLINEVISGKQLTAGANLVHWDGRGREGDLVDDGIYLVTVEALGRKQVKPLAVVR